MSQVPLPHPSSEWDLNFLVPTVGWYGDAAQETTPRRFADAALPRATLCPIDMDT